MQKNWTRDSVLFSSFSWSVLHSHSPCLVSILSHCEKQAQAKDLWGRIITGRGTRSPRYVATTSAPAPLATYENCNGASVHYKFQRDFQRSLAHVLTITQRRLSENCHGIKGKPMGSPGSTRAIKRLSGRAAI